LQDEKTWNLEEKVLILKEAETNGVVGTCRKNGIYAATYYKWEKKYNEGRESTFLLSYAKREREDIKRLEKKNERLKMLLAEEELEIEIKKELLKKERTVEKTRNDNREIYC
jgi:putative transposase